MGLVALVLGALLLGTGIWGTLAATQPAADTATRIVQELASNKAGDVYDNASPEFRRSVSRESFVAETSQEEPFKDFSSVSFSGRSVMINDGVTRAVLTGKVKTTENQSVPISIRLRKIDDTWALTYLTIQPE